MVFWIVEKTEITAVGAGVVILGDNNHLDRQFEIEKKERVEQAKTVIISMNEGFGHVEIIWRRLEMMGEESRIVVELVYQELWVSMNSTGQW